MINKNNTLSCFAKIFGLAFLFILTARAESLLVSDLGEFSLIWLPAGVSLAALLLFDSTLWPGIALGAFLAAQLSGVTFFHALTSVVISPLETLLAVYLLKRVKFNPALARTRDITHLILRGAFLAPILSAAAAAAILCLSGEAAWASFFSVFWPRSLSHTTGVLILTPILLVLVRILRKLPTPEPILFPLAGMLLGTTLIASVFIWMSEERYLQIQLNNDTAEMVREIELEVEKNIQYLVALEGLYAASEVVERDEFNAFATQMLNNMPAAEVVEWIPLVPNSERAEFEQAAQSEGLSNFIFTEFENGKAIPVEIRSEYFPAYFVEPAAGNELELGFDNGSDKERLDAINRAAESGQPSTALIAPLTESDTEKLLSIYIPVYNSTTTSSTELLSSVQGFIAGTFQIEDLAEEALGRLNPKDIELVIFDTTHMESGIPLAYHSCTAASQSAVETPLPILDDLQTSMYHIASIPLNGSSWLTIARPCPAYLAEGHGWTSWAVLVAGSLLTAALISNVGVRQENQQQIELQKTLLENQLEASLDGIYIISETGERLTYNQRFLDLWKIPPDSAILQSEEQTLAHILSLMADPEDAKAELESLRDHHDRTTRQEVALKDGRIFEHYSTPVLSEDGKSYGYLWSYRDITLRKQLEAQLLEAQKMEAIGRLAGGIAHDFNNILVPINLNTELVMQELGPENALYPQLQMILDSAERAANLTNQILAFSRKQMLEMDSINLNEVVNGLEHILQHLIREDIKMLFILDPDLFSINADRGQIEQVLMNLVVNARDAMPTGGRLIIETRNTYLNSAYIKRYGLSQTEGHYVMLAISDTGYGMDTKTQKQIFEPFFTTKEPGKGTGLGLATVFGIIKQHGGNIWVYSEPDKGTTFKIYLPYIKEDLTKSETEDEGPEITRGTETILVVEDEAIVRRLVCETLASHGYDILEAESSYDAIRLASDHRDKIHLLLTDVIMPGMNGKDLYQKIAEINPSIKVLYMSGYTDDIIVHQGILNTGVRFIQKPFTLQVLIQKVRQAFS